MANVPWVDERDALACAHPFSGSAEGGTGPSIIGLVIISILNQSLSSPPERTRIQTSPAPKPIGSRRFTW